MLIIRHIIYISCLMLLFSCYTATAQESFQLSSNWDYDVPDGSSEKIYKIITAFDGSLIAVGEIIDKNKKDSEGLFLSYNPTTGVRSIKKQFGGAGHDSFKSIVQNYDGTFTVVGYTTTKKEKGSWIVLLDRQGKLLKEEKMAPIGALSEELVDVAINLEGAVLAVGNSFTGNSLTPWILPIDKNLGGKKRILNAKELTQATAICAAKAGDFVIIGNTFSKKRSQEASAWVRKVNAFGIEQWEGAKYFGKSGFQNANGICQTSLNDGYLIVGSNSNNSSGKQDMWAMQIDEQGQAIWERLYGGYEDDIAKGVAKISEGGYAIIGHTKSHKLKAKYSTLKIILIDDQGTKLSEKLESIFATKGDNIAHAILEIPSAEDIVITASATHNDFSTPFLGAFTYQLRTPVNDINSTALVLSPTKFEEENKDGVWSANERGYVYIDVTNTTSERLYNIKANIVENSMQPKLYYPKTILLGTIAPNQSKRLVIPVQAKMNWQEECQLDIAIQAGRGSTLLAATLSLSSDADNVASVIRTPSRNDTAISSNEPPSTQEIKQEEVPSIQVSESPEKSGPDYIVWAKPDASMGSKVIDIHKNEAEVKVIAVAGATLQKHRFAVTTNGAQRRGHKMDESTLTAGPTNDQGNTEQSFTTQLHLEPGLNEIQIFYMDEDKETAIGNKSRKITFNYIPPNNPSLWVIAIGIEHQDLAYTKKDAEDFARVYTGLKQTNGNGFKNVNVLSLTQKKDTQKFNIQKTFKDLKNQAIKNGDLVVVFISSHGKISDNKEKFLLLPSDFDSSYEEITSIDFEEDILEQLRPVKGNKLVFVDACNSGGIGARSFTDEATSKVMSDLLETTRGLEVFASCSSQEQSYEDDTWENGAFTKAILEAFKDVTVEVEGHAISADIYKEDRNSSEEITKGKDGVITIRELKEYLKKRVPYLAKKVKKKAQNPLIRRDMNLNHDMGIFMVY